VFNSILFWNDMAGAAPAKNSTAAQ